MQRDQPDRGDQGRDEQGPGAGRPGPADEAVAAVAAEGTTIAGKPGPADETAPAIEPESESVAGQPGPADEANAALGVPVERVD